MGASRRPAFPAPSPLEEGPCFHPSDAIRAANESDIRSDVTLGGKLIIEQAENLVVSYAPFDHIERGARIVIVGITPGELQAANGLCDVRRQLIAGTDQASALAAAKVCASFSGGMRTNLIQMLDHIGR